MVRGLDVYIVHSEAHEVGGVKVVVNGGYWIAMLVKTSPMPLPYSNAVRRCKR